MRNLKQETAPYYSESENAQAVLELLRNAYRMLDNVFIFRNFDTFISEIKAEEKTTVYWQGLYYENLVDHIKITIAFENYNKAILLAKGILVHLAENKKGSDFAKRQKQRSPVTIDEFKAVNDFKEEFRSGPLILSGVNKHLKTISYADTLSDHYQRIIGLDAEFIGGLNRLNSRRNRLHFFIDYAGAFEANEFIRFWTFMRDQSYKYLKAAIDQAPTKSL